MSPEILHTDTGLQAPGSICAANESRFDAAHLSEPLTAFAVGWRDPNNLQELLDFVAPPVMVGRRFEFKQATNAEHFMTETDDVRAIGASFKRIEFSGTSVNAKTLNKGLTVRVDHDEEVGGDWRERYVQLLLQRLLRNELRRAVSALDAEDTNANKVWGANANPDGDLREALKLATNASGIRPNKIVFGEGAWDLRADAYDQQNTAGAFRAAGLTPAEVARKLSLDGVQVIAARYQQSASAKSQILGDQVFCFFAADGVMKDEPSNVKRFVTPADGGRFRVYVDEQAKYTDISVEHYSQIVVTSNLGIRKLTVSAT